jgi:2-succinyl-5-enolpyruvyl-6-hydroxy-3-cyclohexene-1-carboxylate synthase
MALGIAKATRRAVPIICTSGTAAANLFPAIVEAHHSRTPLLVLTADRPPELRHTGASQTIDQIKMFGDAVRWFCEVGVPEDAPHSNAYWRSTMARALAVAEGSPAGPVHLNLAFRDPLVPDGGGFENDLDGRAGGAPWMTVTRPATSLGADDIDRLVTLVSEKRGLVVAGAGHHGPGILELAGGLGWPVLAEAASGLRRGDTITTHDALLRNPSWAESHRPEVVLRLGSVTLSKALAAALRPAQQVLVDPDGWWHDPDRDVSELLQVSGDDVATALAGRVKSAPGEWSESWKQADAAAREAIDSLLDSSPMSEPRVARDVVAGAPEDANVMVAASMPLRDLENFAPPRSDLRFLSNRGANGIDGYVSTAIGIAKGTRRPTIALCGDLSFLHDTNGLMALKEDTVPVTFVVINNDGGGIFSFLPQARFPENFEKVFGTPHGIDLARVAAVHDLNHVLVTRPDDLGTALDGDATKVVEVRTQRESNVELHASIQKAVAAAVG